MPNIHKWAVACVLAVVACNTEPSDTQLAPGQNPGNETAMTGTQKRSPQESNRTVVSGDVPRESLGRWQPLFRLQEPDTSAAEQFLTEIQATPGVPRAILLETTLSWGCACPTWVFPFYRDLNELKHVMVLPASSLDLDPTDFAMPRARFRLSGRFNGKLLTGLDWVEARGKRPPNFPKEQLGGPEVKEYWSQPGLAFIVEDWCYEHDSVDPEEIPWLREQGAITCPD